MMKFTFLNVGEYYEAHRNYHGTLDSEAFGN